MGLHKKSQMDLGVMSIQIILKDGRRVRYSITTQLSGGQVVREIGLKVVGFGKKIIAPLTILELMGGGRVTENVATQTQIGGGRVM